MKRRRIWLESLERRQLLAADGFELPDTESASVPIAVAARLRIGIDSVQVRVNEHIVELNRDHNLLELQHGDEFQIVDVSFSSVENDGIFAIESHLSKLHDLRSPSTIDYADGRFSAREDNAPADVPNGSVPGVEGTWVAEYGWDRLTLNLMHYTPTSVSVSDILRINVHVGSPDLSLNIDALDEFAKQSFLEDTPIELPIHWFNQGEGIQHSYAEVDIYHTSDPEAIIWAGASVGNTGEGAELHDTVRNTRISDPFDEVWTPTEPGEYVLKYYIDPENTSFESDESNNRYDIRINISGNEAPEAQIDRVIATSSQIESAIDVLSNDSDADGDELTVTGFQQPANGTVSLNDDGTFDYRSDTGFTGQDSFTYTVSDGLNEVIGTVEIMVQPGGFEVPGEVIGSEDSAIELGLNVERSFAKAVIVSGLPDGAQLSHGRADEDGGVFVKTRDVAKLTVTPPENSDADFELQITPVVQGQSADEFAKTIRVSVTPVIDPVSVRISSTVVRPGRVSVLRSSVKVTDADGSQSHIVRFAEVPESIVLSAGERDGDDWVVAVSDLTELTLSYQNPRAGSDAAGSSVSRNSNGRSSFEVAQISYTVESTESDLQGEIHVGSGSFRLVISLPR